MGKEESEEECTFYQQKPVAWPEASTGRSVWTGVKFIDAIVLVLH